MDRDEARAGIAASFQKHNSGDREALAELVPLVETELRRTAGELDANLHGRPAASLTALYLQVASTAGIPAHDHPSFLIVCGRSMRRAIVEYMAADGIRDGLTGTEFIRDLDAALETVDAINERLARVVECRYFAGLTEPETSAALAVDAATVTRDWTRARGWLLRELAASGQEHARIANAAWVDAVFDDALGLPAEKLGPFLERCSAAPGELHVRVEELLRFSAAPVPRFEPGDLSADFLLSVLRVQRRQEDAPADASAQGRSALRLDHDTPLVPGSPGWRIIRELRGGRLGPRYLAERPDRPSWPRGVLRFVPGETNLAALRRRPDWRALSSLAHPGIARLMDAGRAEDGRLFIVSELIEGRPLDRYCDDQRLTIQERLALFRRVCQAVQYAHRRLAVHGGIKPSNVVVTANGDVKLLDFGVAGLLAPDAPDGSDGSVPAWMPSPEFASPEQVRGEPLGVASDVYQLGLLLYVLLTGEKAQVLEAPTPGTIEQIVCATVPPPPSAAVVAALEEAAEHRRVRPGSLVRTLRGDLDAIVMYALRKEPDRRYPSVSLLRSDVQRFLERQPVWAQGERRSYRFRKFIVRRSVPIAAGLILAAVGAAAVPGFFPGRLGTPGEAARVAEVEQLLGQMFAPPARPDGVAPQNALLVEQAARIARTELAAHSASQARLFTKIGDTYRRLGHYDRSITILEEALALRRATHGDDSLEVAETLQILGESRHLLARYDEADADLRAVIAIRQVRSGAAHPDTLSATIALGDVRYSRGQFLDGERLLRAAVDALRPGIAKAAADAPALELLPRALVGLANVVRDRGALGEAAVLYREAIALLERNAGAAEQIAAARVHFSRVLAGRGELSGADGELERAIAVLRRSHPDEHPVLGMALRDQGVLRLEQGRLDAAHELLSDALRIQEGWLGRTHPVVARTRALLAELAHRRGQAPEALALSTAALKDFERRGMADHPWTVEIRATLADSLIALGRDDEALGVLNPALTSAPRVLVSYDARLVRLQAALARASRRHPDPPADHGPTGSAP